MMLGGLLPATAQKGAEPLPRPALKQPTIKRPSPPPGLSRHPTSPRIATRLSKPAISQSRRARHAIGSRRAAVRSRLSRRRISQSHRTAVASARAHVKPEWIIVSETVAAIVVVTPTAVLAKAAASFPQTRRVADAAKRDRRVACEARRRGMLRGALPGARALLRQRQSRRRPDWKPASRRPSRSANLSSTPSAVWTSGSAARSDAATLGCARSPTNPGARN